VTLQPDQTLGHYRLVEKIGEGGMGVVWRARDTRLDRDVALKTLPPGLVGEASRQERFIREAKAAAAVSHPNIAAIHDVGEAEGTVYLAMELVEGLTLRELSAGGSLSLGKALAVAAQIAEGLGRAHQEGIVHRDIKPENVIVADSGHAKILDFGLARFRGAREEEQAADPEERETVEALTREGQTVGTVPYMSPEQTRGKATDGRSDLFSLGIVIYEMVTGKLPFQGETPADTMSAILKESPPPPSSLNPEVGERLSELLDKCLQKEPALRYQSAGDLAIDLRRLGDGAHPTFQQAAAGQPASRKGQRPGVVVVAILLIAGLAAAWWFSRGGGAASEVAVTDAGVALEVAAKPIRSLAVLPLDDHSPGDEEQYFADGMTEALIAEIAQIADLRVISRTSVMQYRKNRPPLRQIAEELGVDAVVEGSILRAGGRIRIIAQLIRAPADEHIWAGTYERKHERVLTLQREVAVAIAEEIQGTLRPDAARLSARARAIDPEAHMLVLRGQQSLELGTEESMRRGLVQFRTAVKIDPRYAMAWVGIANVYAGLANTYVAPREVMPRAKAAVLRALAIDPDLAEAYATLSDIQFFFEWNRDEAWRSLRRALEINPNLAEAVLSSGFGEIWRGNRVRAIELVHEARKLAPLSPDVGFGGMWALILSRDYEGALVLAEDVVSQFPTSALAQSNRASALRFMGRQQEAVAVAEQVVELEESVWSLASLALTQGVAGQKEEARKTLARLEVMSNDRYQCPYETALSWAAVKEYDRAQEFFEQGIEERALCWAGGDMDPRTEELREFPWFQELLARRTPMGPDDPDYVPIPPDLDWGHLAP
jgi:TolB-like protein/Flp pilus assembly protein TadD